jgi:mono/diheme cytochrome c family protein
MMRSLLRYGAAAATLLLAMSTTAQADTAQTPESRGAAIYLHGVTGSGGPLTGSRQAGSQVTGADAACVNCHQRSGLGTIEGRIRIPPITGQYLFQQRTNSTLPYVESIRNRRESYTDSTFARALREGVDADGHSMDYLMPRFDLSDADRQALTAYLKSLEPHRVPGVTDSVLHFATVVTPEADPAKARAVLDVIEHYFADKNSFNTSPTKRIRASGRTMASESMFRVNRRYELHEWLLTGPPAGWREQLRQHMAREPVLAVVSGIGGLHWEPVHDFCEQQHVPCLFPNVEVPVELPGDFYSLYLSNGVLLEAQILADRLLKSGVTKASFVQQIYRSGDSGEAAARVLETALRQEGISVHNRVLPAKGHNSDVVRAVRETSGAGQLVLWLRAADVADLPDVASPPHAYLSGLMSGLDKAPLPASWRSHTQMVYPVDLPERRVVRVDYPLGWFRIQRIPVVDEKLQVDTFLACGLVVENLSHLVDTFVPEYVIERMQEMVEHRVLTGYYPHLSLATNQHFASKGAYWVHFTDPNGARVAADDDWMVP